MAHHPICRGIRSHCGHVSNDQVICADCQFLHEQQLGAAEDIEFLRHCRALRDYVDQGFSAHFSPYVAAVLIGSNGQILDIDDRSAEYLHSSRVLSSQHNRLSARDKSVNDHLAQAIVRVSTGGKADTVICSAAGNSGVRYAILLQPNPGKTATFQGKAQPIACFIFPLGRRRIASAQQLISMFGLSPAEARLARALCHGETLEEYAEAQNVKLPTVKTQLRAIFTKTETDRQVALVNLIVGIPPLR